MKYAKEVIDLLGAHPGREFRMIQIVRHVADGHPSSPAQWERVRKGVRRVLDSMEDTGTVGRRDSLSGTGGFSLYFWKPGHEVLANRDVIRDNTCRGIAT